MGRREEGSGAERIIIIKDTPGECLPVVRQPSWPGVSSCLQLASVVVKNQ